MLILLSEKIMHKNNKYRIKIYTAFLLMLFPLLTLSAQLKTYRALIVDENMQPVSGANVFVNNNKLAVTSSAKGVLVFEAEPNASKLISRVGYVSELVTETNDMPFVVLRTDLKQSKMSVGYNSVTKSKNTASISTIEGESLHNSVSAMGTALYGKIPGLFMQQGSGEPGDDQPLYYFIRGTITYGSASNQPLVMVDGFERDINTIQVEDVQSVSVLKDAAASVIYGARGANGVILVTTKRGSEGPIKASVSVQAGIEAPSVFPQFLSSYDFAKKYHKAYEMDGLPMASLHPRYDTKNMENYKNGNPYYYPNIDWLGEIVKPSSTRRQTDVQVSGGNSIGRYFVSMNYLGSEGLYKNTQSPQGWNSNASVDRFRFRSNMDVNIKPNWTLRADISGQIDTKIRPVMATTDFWNLLYKAPGNQFPIIANGSVYGGGSGNTVNPMAEVQHRGYRRLNERTIMSNVETKYDMSNLVDGLKVGLRFGYDNTYSNREGWSRTYQVQDIFTGLSVDSIPIAGNVVGNAGAFSYFGPDSDGQNDRMTIEAFTEYNRTFSDKHTVDAMFMYHQDKYILDGDPKAYAYQFGGGKVGYDFKQKYLTEFSFSYSGTENFTKENRFGFFPALSAGWVVSEENFLKHSNAIDFLKLRASAGMVGNSAVGDRFTYVTQYVGGSSWAFGSANTAASGIVEGTYPNVNFSFEKAYKYEMGIEANFFKNLMAWANVYYEKRTDILTSSNSITPGLFGGNIANINAGITQRKGIEFAVSFNKQTRDWGFKVGVNGAYNLNKIISINEEPKPYSYLSLQGTPISQPFMLETIGFFADEVEIANSPFQSYGEVKPGDIKYKDQNNDNIINDLDRKPMMNGFRPKAEFGFDLAIRYKGFEFVAFIQSQLGRSVNLSTNPAIFHSLQAGSSRISTFAANSWTPETAATADYPRLTTLANSNNYQESNFWYRNGNFVRLRNVEVAYSLPQSLLATTKIKSVRFFARGLNLLTLDNVDMVDPEVLTGYPVMKSYNFGLNVQF